MHQHRLYAGIAQLVEHDLAKVGVASSNLVSRSNFYTPNYIFIFAILFYATLVGPRPSVGQLANLVSRSNFYTPNYCETFAFDSMRPLWARDRVSAS
jgi:hypothetical protein